MTECNPQKCKILTEDLAEICETHYSEFMDYPMQTSLLTNLKYAKRIWEKLGIKIEFSK